MDTKQESIERKAVEIARTINVNAAVIGMQVSNLFDYGVCTDGIVQSLDAIAEIAQYLTTYCAETKSKLQSESGDEL